jgi:ProP effector
MTSVAQNPLKQRPILRLKLGRPASAPEPEPVTATVKVEEAAPQQPTKPSSPGLNEAEKAGRALRAEQRAKWEASEARRERAFKIRDTLIERWPDCFRGPEQAKLPLKTGIHRDIKAIAPELSSRDLGTAIAYYVNDYKYRQAMIEGAARVDLDGNAAGIVTKDQAGRSAMKLKGKEDK